MKSHQEISFNVQGKLIIFLKYRYNIKQVVGAARDGDRSNVPWTENFTSNNFL